MQTTESLRELPPLEAGTTFVMPNVMKESINGAKQQRQRT
jgi:hypothetical protein